MLHTVRGQKQMLIVFLELFQFIFAYDKRDGMREDIGMCA